jgi:hypothetical protein
MNPSDMPESDVLGRLLALRTLDLQEGPSTKAEAFICWLHTCLRASMVYDEAAQQFRITREAAEACPVGPHGRTLMETLHEAAGLVQTHYDVPVAPAP